MARQSVNICLEPGVFDDFCYYSGPLGIKPSAWVNAKMKEFIEQQRAIQGERKSKSDILPQVRGR